MINWHSASSVYFHQQTCVKPNLCYQHPRLRDTRLEWEARAVYMEWLIQLLNKTAAFIEPYFLCGWHGASVLCVYKCHLPPKPWSPPGTECSECNRQRIMDCVLKYQTIRLMMLSRFWTAFAHSGHKRPNRSFRAFVKTRVSCGRATSVWLGSRRSTRWDETLYQIEPPQCGAVRAAAIFHLTRCLEPFYILQVGTEQLLPPGPKNNNRGATVWAWAV